MQSGRDRIFQTNALICLTRSIRIATVYSLAMIAGVVACFTGGEHSERYRHGAAAVRCHNGRQQPGKTSICVPGWVHFSNRCVAARR